MMKRTEFCDYINQYRKQLYAVAYAILNSKVDTEDAVCSAIEKGYAHLDQLKNSSKFKPWMITITRNEALQIKRKRLHLPGDDQIAAMLEPVEDEYNELLDVVQKLQEEYRIVIVLFYYNDLSIKDIAKILDVPVGTVKSRLNRGRELLKRILGETEVEK